MNPQIAVLSSPVPLQSIIITEELAKRFGRPPNHAAVSAAMVKLSQVMANSPEQVLQRLVETALELCQAQSSGISLLEEEKDRKIFRWHGVAGEYAPHLGGSTPREFSPCGTVLDTDRVQLMSRPDRHFEYFAEVEPRIEEALLIPFHIAGEPVGTIWVIAHDRNRRFDSEDARVMGVLAEFAAAAYQVTCSMNALNKINSELALAQQTLKNTNRDLEQFAFIAGHDLNEPLRTVTAFTQLLCKKLAGKLDPETTRVFELITDGTRRMKALIDDLLEYSRLGLDDAHPFEQASLQTVLDAAIANLRGVIEEQHGVVTCSPLPAVRIDAAQITRVFQNLIQNAVKYRRKDEAPRIHVSAEKGQYYWTISVTDNGEGFSMEYSDQIFTVFKRLHNREIPGSGLGLALCRRIVERHSGAISATSRPAHGSVFSFTLPV